MYKGFTGMLLSSARAYFATQRTFCSLLYFSVCVLTTSMYVLITKHVQWTQHKAIVFAYAGANFCTIGCSHARIIIQLKFPWSMHNPQKP